jgi:hypothetical protein
MTNEQILVWASKISYAYIAITPTCTIGPGRDHWEAQLPVLSSEERERLAAKIARQEARLQREQDSKAIRQRDVTQNFVKPSWPGLTMLR